MEHLLSNRRYTDDDTRERESIEGRMGMGAYRLGGVSAGFESPLVIRRMGIPSMKSEGL
jgi:hypothetical protein